MFHKYIANKVYEREQHINYNCKKHAAFWLKFKHTKINDLKKTFKSKIKYNFLNDVSETNKYRQLKKVDDPKQSQYFVTVLIYYILL